MGNCQAIDAATLVIQHPNGKVEKLYWSVSACHVMKMNPGHYVALLLSTTIYPSSSSISSTINNNNNIKSNTGSVRLTKIKLLKPTDTLLLGHAYRLITTQEVKRGLKAKKKAKVKQSQTDSTENLIERVEVKDFIEAKRSLEDYQVPRSERTRPNTSGSSKHATTRPRTSWQPSLNSISEANGD